MKKFLIVLVTALTLCFLNFYKSPIISTDVALNNAEQYLLNPPKEWVNAISFNGLEELTEENISMYLIQKNGFWNKLTNRMQWEITINSSEIYTTVIMDAHTGKFIDLFGGFS